MTLDTRPIPWTIGAMAFFSFPELLNERAARVVAAGVALTSAVALATGWWGLVPVLAAGFLLRVGWGPRFSPLARTALWVAGRLWEPRIVVGAPKRFAQAVGAVFTLTASVLFATGADLAAMVLMAVLIVFATLEAGLAFCMGCWVYGQLQAAGLIAPDACVDCGPAPSN